MSSATLSGTVTWDVTAMPEVPSAHSGHDVKVAFEAKTGRSLFGSYLVAGGRVLSGGEKPAMLVDMGIGKDARIEARHRMRGIPPTACVRSAGGRRPVRWCSLRCLLAWCAACTWRRWFCVCVPGRADANVLAVAIVSVRSSV